MRCVRMFRRANGKAHASEQAVTRLRLELISSEITRVEIRFRHLVENHATSLLPVLQHLPIERTWGNC